VRTLRRIRAVAPLFALALSACPGAAPSSTTPTQIPREGTAAPTGTPPVPAAAPKLLVLPVGAARPATGSAVAFAEIAWTNAQRERGLMGRDHLETDHGMLFVYPRPVPRRFWMKGCTTGLDIAFVRADGTVSRIATLGPGEGIPDDRVPIAESGGPVLYVLEMEPGWFERHGVAEGDAVDVSAAARGVEAE
jgi:uncharacterized protein